MDETKQKILKRLEELLSQIPGLKKENYDSELTDLWEERVKKLLERIGGEKLIKDFHHSGATAFNMYASERELQEYYLKRLSGYNNFLTALKEDLELFDETDESTLTKLKHKFEVGANLGIIKGKYSQEREK